MSCKKGLSARQAEYVHSKCKNEGILGTEQCMKENGMIKKKTDSELNPYECAMLYDFELHNIHAESAETGSGLFSVNSSLS